MAGPAPREATASGARAVLAFGDPDCAQVARAGGKGASLARLSALGLPVPPGFVVPADRLVASLPDGGAALRAAHAAQAQAAVARADPPPEIGAAYEALGDAVLSPCARAPAPRTPRRLLCRPAGDVPARPRRRRRARRRRDCWASFFSKRAVLPRASGLARRPGDGRRRAADGAGGRGRRAVHLPPGPAAARPDGGRGGAGAGGGLRGGHAGSLRDQARRHRQARAGRDAAVHDRRRPGRRYPAASAGAGGGQCASWETGARDLPASATTSSGGWGARRTSSGRSRKKLYVLQARPVTTR